MKRPQFTLRSLQVAMLVVAAFFGGMAVQKQLDKPVYIYKPPAKMRLMSPEEIELPDGSRRYRFAPKE